MVGNKKMKTPELKLVEQESGRQFKINLISRKQVEDKDVITYFKVDYREEILQIKEEKEHIIKRLEQEKLDREKEEQDAEFRRQ